MTVSDRFADLGSGVELGLIDYADYLIIICPLWTMMFYVFLGLVSSCNFLSIIPVSHPTGRRKYLAALGANMSYASLWTVVTFR